MSKKVFSENMETAIQKARAYIFSKYKIPESDVEDIIQEASLKAVKKYDQFRGKCSFYTWFIAICKNEIKHYFRTSSRQDFFQSQDGRPKEHSIIEPEIKRKSDIEESEFLIHEALGKLSEKHKEIIELLLENAGTSKDMAKILQIPITSARTRLFYAKRRLKKLIKTHAHKSNIQLVNYR